MKYTQCLIAGDNKNGNINDIKLFPWPDRSDKAGREGYYLTVGAAFSAVHDLTDEGIKAQLMFDSLELVKRGANPRNVHEVFIEIDEYSAMCPNGPPKMSKVTKMAKMAKVTWY